MGRRIRSISIIVRKKWPHHPHVGRNINDSGVGSIGVSLGAGGNSGSIKLEGGLLPSMPILTGHAFPPLNRHSMLITSASLVTLIAAADVFPPSLLALGSTQSLLNTDVLSPEEHFQP